MLLVKNIGYLITFNGLYWSDMGVVKDAAMLIDDEFVFWLGSTSEVLETKVSRVFNAGGNVVIPGLIDCHTHLIFAGNRANEFAMRARGESYLNIMNIGGGILNTMRAVRKASKQELIDLALPRLEKMLKFGVTTIEAKSGYGLNLNDELKMLDALVTLRKNQPIDIEVTFLGAHTIPPEYIGNKKKYVSDIIHQILPGIVKHNTVKFCDIFIEKNAFNVEDAAIILGRAKSLGLECKVHAEQLTHQGGASLAAKIGAISVSHLEFINDADVKVIAQKDVVAEILPISYEYLGGTQLPPTKDLMIAGAKICVASDFNPGSAMCNDIQLALRLAVVRNGLTCEQALLGATKNAAYSLKRNDIGQIKVGTKADFCVLNTNNLWEFFSDWTKNTVSTVFKNGLIVHSLINEN